MKSFLFITAFFVAFSGISQNRIIRMNDNWTFRMADSKVWMPATVPGSVHTDLIRNQSIPDPFFSTNESKVQWVDSADWIYQHYFFTDDNMLAQKNIDLVFEGLDTYADVYMNDSLILKADNMFVRWQVPVKPALRKGQNRLWIHFHSAIKITDSIAKAALPLVRPDNNRLYARKAQFQFGWDWGPRVVGCGIYRSVWMDIYPHISTLSNIQTERDIAYRNRNKEVRLLQEPDAKGRSFTFIKNGQPFYMKGANWIPASIFPGIVTREDYRRLLTDAKNANMNMLRVWGGGIYENDDFYDLCDSLGIYVWQDFMFAGAMYPADSNFLNNVKKEVTCQVQRLRHHPCIVLWCGNNEIDEAWNNWGWQNHYNLHGRDSAFIWKEYITLFRQKLADWVRNLDSTRPYISTSPMHGWGHPESFSEGDSHYWGLWWGLEDWETFRTHTGRFVSEFGMQSMSSFPTITSYTDSTERYMYSPYIMSHQKAGEGFKKLNHYLTRYFIDSATLSKISLQDYCYLTQCMQAFILRNVIATQRKQFPRNMGSLLWQLNDCWPVTSWSLIDGNGVKKAAWYAVKRAYSDNADNVIDTINRELLTNNQPEYTIKLVGANSFSISSDCDTKYVYIENAAVSDNYFDLKKGEIKIIMLDNNSVTEELLKKLKVYSLNEFYLNYR